MPVGVQLRTIHSYDVGTDKVEIRHTALITRLRLKLGFDRNWNKEQSSPTYVLLLISFIIGPRFNKRGLPYGMVDSSVTYVYLLLSRERLIN